MKPVLRRIIAAAALALLWAIVTTPSAFAQCHIGAQAGGSIANTSADVTGFPLGIDGIGMHSTRPDFGVHAGCSIRVAHTAFVAGLWAERQWQDVAFTATLGGPSFKAAIGDSYSLGGNLGYRMESGVVPYVVLGHTWSDVNWSVSSPMLPSSIKGWTFGGGVEIPLGNNLSFVPEVRLTRYDKADLGGVASLQADQVSAMARINWNFSGLFMK